MNEHEPMSGFPDDFEWQRPETWPEEVRLCFQYAAQLAYISLVQIDKKMLDCRIEGTEEPVTMFFAIGDRAEELRRAWRSVYALHNDDAKTPGDA